MSIGRLSKHLRTFRQDRQGVAIVEFAMVLPIMLVAYCGSVDLCSMVMASRKTTQLTSALADLTARVSSVTTGDLGNIFNASQMIMAPFDAGNAHMSITNIVIDSTGVARVCWSSQRNSTAPARGTTVAIPASIRVPNTSVIMAKASYSFTPIAGYVVTGTVTLGDDAIYTRPRGAQALGSSNIEQVSLVDTRPCPDFS